MSTVQVERAPEVTREVTAADVLERAADLLEEFGWCQGQFGSKGYGSFCAIGAIFEASVDLSNRNFSALAAPLGYKDGSDLGASLSRWNDREGRTKEEVVALLRSGAEAARA